MPDYSIYAGRWIALTENNDVASVSTTLDEARYAARMARPKEHLRLVRISPHAPYLALPEWPLAYLNSVLPASGIWLAGGPVRDLLLGRPLHDWDFAVEKDGRRLARKVADALDAAYYPLDDERDTGRVVVTDPHTGHATTLDFALLRGTNLEEDLLRRDFTINAMAITLDGALIDPTHGQADLDARLIRMTNPASFKDDPARLLRAVRQAGSLNMRLERRTEFAICAQAKHIRTIAPERIRAELLNIMHLVPAASGLQALAGLGLLTHILPEVQALQSVRQTWPHHYADTHTHTLAAISAVESLFALLKGETPPKDCTRRLAIPSWAWSRLAAALSPLQGALLAYLDAPINAEMSRIDLLKWAALFHDVGKRETRTVDKEGHAHFYGHAEAGVRATAARLSALHFPNKATTFITTLVDEHMRLISLGKSPPTRRTVYRFYRDTGDTGVAVVLLSLADALAVWGRELTQERWRTLLTNARALITPYFKQPETVVKPTPLLNGHDLVAMGVPQGPEIGRLLEMLREAQASGEVTNRENATVYMQTQLAHDLHESKRDRCLP